MDGAGTATEEARPTPRVGEVIERLGVGPVLVIQTILGAGVWLVGGAQLIVISVTTKAISDEWDLEGWQRSSTVAITFVGILLGNMAGGAFSDTLGRRLPILAAYIFLLIFGTYSAFVGGIVSLCICRLMLGVSFGMQQPSWHALCSEITPPKLRMVSNVASGCVFIVGEVYGCLFVWLDDPSLKHLHWRKLMLTVSAPAAILAMLAILFLNESPTWLALQGETERATQILQSIRYWNGKEHEPIDFSTPVVMSTPRQFESAKEQLQVSIGPALWFTTLVLSFSCFALNLLYYGGYYAFPLVLGEVDMGVSPAIAILVGALSELPGYVATLIMCEFCGRRPSILAYLALTALSTIMFVSAAGRQGTLAQLAVNAGFAGMKCWVTMGFSIVYQYVTEVYPTSARGVGTGICLGCGRIGSISSPFVFEGMIKVFPWSAFFYGMVAVCVVNALGILLVPFETKGVILIDHVDEVREGDPLLSCHGRKP